MVDGLSPEDNLIFKGVQFNKNIFQDMSEEELVIFRKTFFSRLNYVQRVITGETRAAGNSLKLVRRKAPHSLVFKRRLGKKRLSMVLSKKVITLLRCSSHDRQMKDINRRQGKIPGCVYYSLADFRRRLVRYEEILREEGISFSEFMNVPECYICDTDQQNILELGEDCRNVSVIGNAGAGKSLVGLKWLADEQEKGSSIYLTMSSNLVYTLGYELGKSSMALKLQEKKCIPATVKTTFDFIREQAHSIRPDIPERCYFDSARSFEFFQEFWQEKVNWESFWDHGEADFAEHNSFDTMAAAWRDIHGVIKGAVVSGQDYQNIDKLPDFADKAEYLSLLKKERKGNLRERDIRWVDKLYETFFSYQKYLKLKEVVDDNDLARIILRSKTIPALQYEAAFIDECQDLTQVQLLAIFSLLRRAGQKRLASDRCQMVQPTYFSEGNMRTMANDYSKALGYSLDERSFLPQQLRYNYRSTEKVIDFQNFLVHSFREQRLIALKTEELQEIKVPWTAEKGMLPVWITGTEKNRQLLANEVWKELDSGSVQLITAMRDDLAKTGFDMEGRSAVDIVGCKGMEYPSVLLHNVLSDMRNDPVMAWKYFYVGATRCSECLVFYEDNLSEEMTAVLDEAEAYGFIEKCTDLSEMRGGISWLQYVISQFKRDMLLETQLSLAENALNYGQYELAVTILSKWGQDENLLIYTRGKAAEKERDFCKAINYYGSINAEWHNRGRKRANCSEAMLGNPDVEPVEFIAAFVLSNGGVLNMLEDCRQRFIAKYGYEKGYYHQVQECLNRYPFLEEMFSRWAKCEAVNIKNSSEKVNRTAKSLIGGNFDEQ